MSLRQGSMTMKDYCPKFTQLSKYDPELLSDSRARMSKFLLGFLIWLSRILGLPC